MGAEQVIRTVQVRWVPCPGGLGRPTVQLRRQALPQARDRLRAPRPGTVPGIRPLATGPDCPWGSPKVADEILGINMRTPASSVVDGVDDECGHRRRVLDLRQVCHPGEHPMSPLRKALGQLTAAFNQEGYV